MKTIIYDRKQLNSYKEFYEQLYIDLDGKNIIDWEKFEYLGYSADNLNEFLWYCHSDGNSYIFKNFDLEKIKNYKNYENYKWNLVFEVFEEFVKKYPNNTLEFINEEE